MRRSRVQFPEAALTLVLRSTEHIACNAKNEGENLMRWEVLKRFKFEIGRQNVDFSSCLVVGGTEQDPEYQFIKSLDSSTQVNFLGIEKSDFNFHHLDLNTVPKKSLSGTLVLCSQVLEHVWNHKNFFLNLKELTQENGYLWLNVPMSNFVHGSPDYYSAGFATGYLIKNLEDNGFEIVSSGSIGSRRYYTATHLLGTWLTEKEHKNPLFFYQFQDGTKLGILKKLVIDLYRRAPLLLRSKKIIDSPRYSTEAFVFARKRADLQASNS
jgi:hypothetical protein